MRFKFVIIDAEPGSQMQGPGLHNPEGTRIGQIIAEQMQGLPTGSEPNVFEAEDRRASKEKN